MRSAAVQRTLVQAVYIMGLFSNNIQYAGGFIEQKDGPVMIAMLDGIGMNGLYFRLYMGE